MPKPMGYRGLWLTGGMGYESFDCTLSGLGEPRRTILKLTGMSLESSQSSRVEFPNADAHHAELNSTSARGVTSCH